MLNHHLIIKLIKIINKFKMNLKKSSSITNLNQRLLAFAMEDFTDMKKKDRAGSINAALERKKSPPDLAQPV